MGFRSFFGKGKGCRVKLCSGIMDLVTTVRQLYLYLVVTPVKVLIIVLSESHDPPRGVYQCNGPT